MKKLFLFLVLIACSACSTAPVIQEASKAKVDLSSTRVRLSRYLTIKTCYTGQKKCIGPVAKELEKANIEMVMEPFYKGDIEGEIAQEKHRLVENGTPFKTEIRVLKKRMKRDITFT